jgi:hypothetical protein
MSSSGRRCGANHLRAFELGPLAGEIALRLRNLGFGRPRIERDKQVAPLDESCVGEMNSCNLMSILA